MISVNWSIHLETKPPWKGWGMEASGLDISLLGDSLSQLHTQPSANGSLGLGVFVNNLSADCWKPPSSHILLVGSHHLPGSSKGAEQLQAAFTDSGYLGFLLPPRKAGSRLLAARPVTSLFPPHLLCHLLTPAPVSSAPWPLLFMHLPNVNLGQQSQTRKAPVFPQRF